MKFHVEELLQQSLQSNDEKDKIILVLGTVIDSLVTNAELTQNRLQDLLDTYYIAQDVECIVKDILESCTDNNLIVEI